MLRILICLCLTLLSTAASATIVERFDLSRLVKTADLIVVGEVLSAKAAWREGRIVTTIQMRNDGLIKGAADATIAVEVLGGQVEGLGQLVRGMPRFSPGERVAVFLQKAPSGAWRTVGLSQGKLRVEAGVTGLKLVREFDGLSLVEQRDGAWAKVEPALPAEADLADFLARVNRALIAQPH
ncbi:MAG: hypothetical protein ACI9U2_004007 [Bradymonadia bacterium]|jgi:hypothetical protein